MQISPINNMTTRNYLNSGNHINFGKKEHNNLRTAAGALAISSLIAGGPMVTSCDLLDIEHNALIQVPVDTIHKNDTIYKPIPIRPDTVYITHNDTIWSHDSIPVPYVVRDTIQQIITQRDTIFMKPNYDSPVAPVLKKFFKELEIDPGDGKIPVKMHWTDEKKNAFYQAKFIGDNSSYNEMTFLITKTPFDKEAGGFVIGKNDSYGRVKFSKLSDSQLAIDYETYLGKGKPSMDKNSLWIPVESYVNDIHTGSVDHYLFNKAEQVANKKGEYWPGSMPSSIKYNNNYGDKHYLSSVTVKSTDAPEDIEE